MEAGARSRTLAVKKLSNKEGTMSHRKAYPLALVLALALALAILAAPSTAAIDPRIGYVEREPATAQSETPPTVNQADDRRRGRLRLGRGWRGRWSCSRSRGVGRRLGARPSPGAPGDALGAMSTRAWAPAAPPRTRPAVMRG